MGKKSVRDIEEDPTTNKLKPKKIGWSQRFFIFAAVMFLLGWASTGIMSSAKDQINLDFLNNIRPKQLSQKSLNQSTVIEIPLVEASSPLEANIHEDIDQISENTSTGEENSVSISTPDPTEAPFKTVNQSQVKNPENWEEWYCANCVAVPVHVKLTHYWPPLGGDNCWTFYDDYCYSPTKSTVPWESVVEISAACPVPWLGSVVEIPELNRRYLCLDTGDKVICKDGTCVVDVLTDKIYPWDGMEFEAIVYYPRVWVEPAPTFTPTTTIDQ